MDRHNPISASVVIDIKRSIEGETQKLLAENLFLKQALSRGLNRTQTAQYLFNLMFVLSQTPEHLSVAIQSSKQRGWPELALFFSEKLQEERGHDEWARADLVHFQEKSGVGLKVTQETLAVMNYIRETIDEDPRLYLAYITFTEYFTVIAAPAFLSALSKWNGISAAQLSVVAKHEEADRGHVESDLDEITRFTEGPEIVTRMIRVIRESSRYISECLSSSLVELSG